jgi:hypothetical protein
MTGWRGWNARITSRPRASASMKSGLPFLAGRWCFDVPGDPGFPQKAAFEVARENNALADDQKATALSEVLTHAAARPGSPDYHPPTIW